MGIDLFLTALLLGLALWREGWGFVVWIDLLLSGANFAIFLLQVFP